MGVGDGSETGSATEEGNKTNRGPASMPASPRTPEGRGERQHGCPRVVQPTGECAVF